MRERRANQRTSVELPAYYDLLGENEITHQATVVNISAGGFCFYAHQAIADKTDVELSMQIENQNDIKIKVSTAWSKRIGDTGDYMVGVRINQATGEDLEKFLTFYCKEISSLSTDAQKSIKN